MITIKGIELIDGRTKDVTIESCAEQLIDGTGLTLLPALIDPHVHFRIPGNEHKEDWQTGARAALEGGVTTVFDMPNSTLPCTTAEALRAKAKLIKDQLQKFGLPLRYYLYIGADRKHLKEIPKVKHEVIGIKVFMGSSTGDLLIDDESTLSEVFKIAAANQMLISVHAEDEGMIKQNKARILRRKDVAVHSQIHSREAAMAAVKIAIGLAEKHGTRLCILHVSMKEEMELIRQAKKRGVVVCAEVCPRHLFLDDTCYTSKGMLAKVNPPLRSSSDRQALWEAIQDGTVDFIGSDHSPYTLAEKALPYDDAPAGAPGVHMTLPLLLDAANHGWISLKQIAALTRTNIETIFKLSPNNDVVLVNRRLRHEVRIDEEFTKCGWSLFHGMTLTGWPVATIIRGHAIELGGSKCLLSSR